MVARPSSLPHEEAVDPLTKVARRASFLWSADRKAPRRLEVMGLPFENVTMDAAVDDLAEAASVNRPTRVVFVNAHVINSMHRFEGYEATVRSADRLYADGSGMALAARFSGKRLVDNVNGTDLFPILCREALRRGQTVYLLGSEEGVADAVVSWLAGLGLGAAVAGFHHGYFADDSAKEAELIDKINGSCASFLLAGLGVPFQDQWLERNRHRISVPVLVGVGGLFDYYSGRIPRAPLAFRAVGCEWVWRLMMEPSRMWRRYLIGNVRFLAHALTRS